MVLDTFGSPEKYKVLYQLTKLVSELPIQKQKHISTFLTRFGNRLKHIRNIPDTPTMTYVLHLMYEQYEIEINTMRDSGKYDKEITSRLMNLIHAKIKNKYNI